MFGWISVFSYGTKLLDPTVDSCGNWILSCIALRSIDTLPCFWVAGSVSPRLSDIMHDCFWQFFEFVGDADTDISFEFWPKQIFWVSAICYLSYWKGMLTMRLLPFLKEETLATGLSARFFLMAWDYFFTFRSPPGTTLFILAKYLSWSVARLSSLYLPIPYKELSLFIMPTKLPPLARGLAR